MMTLPGLSRAIALTLGILVFATRSAGAADPLTEAQARAAIAPFYKALTAAPGNDVAVLVSQATSADWVSCNGNDICRRREQVIAGITGLRSAVPDLQWEIKEVLVAGNTAVVRGEASGTPAGGFMGAPHTGKGFKVMSIDVHTIADGKMIHSYHVEDWIGATRQLAGQ